MIIPTFARIIIREHLFKPIKGKVLSLGCQTTPMKLDECLALFREEGCEPVVENLKSLPTVNDEQTRFGKGQGYITDRAFWALLGVKDFVVMDVSDYEGCEIVHNMNTPVPAKLHNQFDFIFDGGAFDHMFDIRVAFQNISKMLTVGGRVLQVNSASNGTGVAYITFGPDLIYDYYVLNRFADCKVYVAETDTIGGVNEVWEFYEFKGNESYEHFKSSKVQWAIVLAEKGPDSTDDQLPVQFRYRPESIKAPYVAGEELRAASKRKTWKESVNGKPQPAEGDFKSSLRSCLKGFAENLPNSIKGLVPSGIKTKIFAKILASEMKDAERLGFRSVKGYRYLGPL